MDIGRCIQQERDPDPLILRCFNSACYCGKEMIRRHQIDVIRTLCLQFKENLRQPFRGDLFPGFSTTDGLILAVDTAQAATGEEYGP